MLNAIILFLNSMLFSRHYYSTNCNLHHPQPRLTVDSLQIAVQSLPNPTNTITYACTIGGGVGVTNSDAVVVIITIEVTNK